jgi:hypothetical protein
MSVNRTAPTPELLPFITPSRLFLGLAGLSLVVVILGTCLFYSTDGPLPPPKAPPPLPEKTALTNYRYKEGYYRALVEEDAKKAGLTGFDHLSLLRANAHSREFSGEQLLKPGGTLETTHLRLKVTMDKIWVGEEGQGFRTEHLILGIANRTQLPVAYVVQTTVPGGNCSNKGVIPQNAIALLPGEEATRTECLPRSVPGVTVKSVEVLELSSPLAYSYVSRLDPQRLLLDARTAEGHQVKTLGACKILPWRIIQGDLTKGGAKWRDVLDFYARHNCDEYSYFAGYRWSEVSLKRLPVVPPNPE